LPDPGLPDSAAYAAGLRQARAYQQAGKFGLAEQICRDIVQKAPHNAAAWHRLGVLAYLQGRPMDAIAMIERAIAQQHATMEFHVSLCLALLASGQHEKFEACMHSAEGVGRSMLTADSGDAEVLHRLGVLADLRGEHGAAVELITRAVALQAGDPEYHNNLGLALLGEHRAEAAGRCFGEALQLNPQYVGAANNLALALETQGKFAEAIAACRQVLQLKPDFPLAWFNLGNMLQQHGDQKEAEQSFLRALELQPDYAEARNNLGEIYEKQGRVEEAIVCYRSALALRPLDIQPYVSLGRALHTTGRTQEAEAVYRDAQKNIRDARFDILIATMLPPIMPQADGIAADRARYERELGALLKRPIRIDDLGAEGLINFFLAYHGQDDKSLQQLLARVFVKARPELAWSGVAPRPAWDGKRKLRVGFISSFFKNHSIAKLNSGVMANLARERFEVTALFAPPFKDDGASQYIASHADRHHLLPTDLQEARVFIAGLNLDLLYYTDIGMDTYTYFLAFARLAPVQGVGWGHPMTTGIPNIDFFMSHEDCEVEGAQANYSEKLVCIRPPAMYTYFWRPELPERMKTRADFGFAENLHLYVCPQALFKFHPDFDPVLDEILRRDPLGRLVLIDGTTLAWNDVLMRRFGETMADDVLKRVVFVPRLYGNDFIHLIALCDVMLDPLYFVGATSSFEAFATGIPIVTLPSQYQRGRYTHAFYRRMSIEECTASTLKEYAEIALRLGMDSAYRAQVRDKILKQNHKLYNDLGAVREFERCFEEMCRNG
jgi:protein O-GlcNAc transferase